jgi:trehalose-6-phosphate synthase
MPTQSMNSSVVLDERSLQPWNWFCQKPGDESQWCQYYKDNRVYATEVLSSIKARYEEDPSQSILVEIHDEQYMLVPSLLRKMLANNCFYRKAKVKIGFFLRHPFPPHEDLKTIPNFIRKELTSALLSADLLGFHHQEHIHHFVDGVRKHFTDIVVDRFRRVQRKHHTTTLTAYEGNDGESEFLNDLENTVSVAELH